MATEKYIGLVILLFFLSMICERVADFLKHYLSDANTGFGYRLGKKLGIGNLLVKGENDSLIEDKRYYRILKINIWCGFLTALALHADIFSILRNTTDPWAGIGWEKYTMIWEKKWEWDWSMFYSWLPVLVGFFATGFFISFGSKFWHDLLDIILQIKNYKRIMADPETYKVSDVGQFDEVVSTSSYKSVLAAYDEAKRQWAEVKEVITLMYKWDQYGYYIEARLSKNTDAITSPFIYHLEKGASQSIRVSKVITKDLPKAVNLNLSDSIFNSAHTAEKGTMGCLVKQVGKNDIAVLTCFHNIVEPSHGYTFRYSDGLVATMTDKTTTLSGKVINAIRDNEIDAALISIDKSTAGKITNQISGFGRIRAVGAPLLEADLTHHPRKKLSFCGLMTKNGNGELSGVYCDVNIEYGRGLGSHKLQNLIAVSKDGKAVSIPGDSGSSVIDEESNLVGFVVAADEEYTYVIPAWKVFDKMGLELYND